MGQSRTKIKLGWQWWLFGSIFLSVAGAWACLLEHVNGPFLAKFGLMIVWAAVATPLHRMSFDKKKGFSLVRALQLVLPAGAAFLAALVLLYGSENLRHASYAAVQQPGLDGGEAQILLWTAVGAHVVFTLAWPWQHR